MLRRKIFSGILIYTFLLSTVAFGQATAPAKAVYQAPRETIDKIKDEGMNRSQVMPTLSYLTDVIGGRLTNSPSMKRANEWTRDKMKEWGMQNAKLEAWGPFGRGWSLKSFSAQLTSPQTINLNAYPKAWSPSTRGAVTGEVVYLDIKTEEDLAKYRGQLKGKIVMVSPLRNLKPIEKALSARFTDEELAKIADPASAKPTQELTPEVLKNIANYFNQQARRIKFLMQEGATVMLDNSSGGSGGTLFVQEASLAVEVSPNMKSIDDLFNDAGFQPYRKGADANMLPQVTVATEDYNRLMRMIRFGIKPTMTVEISSQYHDDDLMGYNTIAEIPGSDPKLKDEVVMVGAHMDSWHSSTGATDNAAGSAAAMEAARIILASGLKPRRTIRVALWSGEEQGLFGSEAYVKQHFGEMKGGGNRFAAMLSGTEPPKAQLVKGADYEKLSAYYNLDNGTGKIRGVYLQGNAAVAPIFRSWLEPFKESGATTITLSNTGGTDHESFDAIGLPGFQFIQDEIEYGTRTHHSNQDVFDRIQADDMKQASMIMAAFVYQTAMMDGKLPRKEMK